MRHQELQNHFADSIHLLGSGSDDQIIFNRINAGNNELCPTALFYFNDSKAAPSERFQFFMVTERGDGKPDASGCLQDGHPFPCLNFIPVNL
jgi:hypothetical protein